MGDSLQIKKQPKQYDAIIVGSGAGGGMAAYVLANAGLKVCLLEAGANFDPAIHSSQLKNPWESARRGASTKFRPFGDFDGCYHGWDIEGEPFTHAPGDKWEWWRARMVGVPTIGEEFHCVLVQMISNIKASMVWVMTGQSVMMM
jgi:choline dehydrogenase-like flavoprotein